MWFRGDFIAKALEGWNVSAFDVNPLAVVATKENSEVAGVNESQ